jgi:hypothetical protein
MQSEERLCDKRQSVSGVNLLVNGLIVASLARDLLFSQDGWPLTWLYLHIFRHSLDPAHGQSDKPE